MNVPGIRRAITAMRVTSPLHVALVRVGLRACDEAENPCLEHDNYNNCAWCSHDAGQMQLLADILRESGVEVGE